MLVRTCAHVFARMDAATHVDLAVFAMDALNDDDAGERYLLAALQLLDRQIAAAHG